MSEFKLTSVEEFEQATNELLETGAKVGADAWQFRVKNQTPHCKFLLPYLYDGTLPYYTKGTERNLRMRCTRYCRT